MVNFSHSQYSFSSPFYQVKTFSICDEKITHLSSVQAKLLKNLFDWFQLGFDFYMFFVENVRPGHSSLWISLASFVVIADGKHLFFANHQHGSLSS